MQTANMMAHAKSTSIPVTENGKEANYNLNHFCSSSIFLVIVRLHRSAVGRTESDRPILQTKCIKLSGQHFTHSEEKTSPSLTSSIYYNRN